MGFVVDEECGRDAHAPVEEAIRRHLRPELINRLTKIVHFAPLGMEAAREIVIKLLAAIDSRVSAYGFTLVADTSAVDFILREGFSPEYGARHLERTIDRMLGPMIVDKMLANSVVSPATIRLEVREGHLVLQVPHSA